jgi:hypothetical protein
LTGCVFFKGSTQSLLQVVKMYRLLFLGSAIVHQVGHCYFPFFIGKMYIYTTDNTYLE